MKEERWPLQLEYRKSPAIRPINEGGGPKRRPAILPIDGEATSVTQPERVLRVLFGVALLTATLCNSALLIVILSRLESP